MVPWAQSSQLPPNKKGISISSTVFAGHICVTNTQADRQTDRQTHTPC